MPINKVQEVPHQLEIAEAGLAAVVVAVTAAMQELLAAPTLVAEVAAAAAHRVLAVTAAQVLLY
jgi:hypothetical protein